MIRFSLIISLLFSGVCYSQSLSSDPFKSKFIYTDVDNFWKAFELFTRDTSSNPFEDYIRNGTAGLHDFIPTRIVSATALRRIVKKERHYYEAIRPSANQFRFFENQIRASFFALKHLYPKAIFPDTYFVIGRISSGGTSSDNGLIIGAEVFADTLVATTHGRKPVRLEFLPFTVAHELIHFQQMRCGDSEASLLKQCIIEGSADFLTTRIAGDHVKLVNGTSYTYGSLHERQLWEEFMLKRKSKDFSGWLYEGVSKNERPSDLGYWIGYQITEAYFNKQEDKLKAIDDILNICDYEDFLIKSGYDKKFKK